MDFWAFLRLAASLRGEVFNFGLDARARSGRRRFSGCLGLPARGADDLSSIKAMLLMRASPFAWCAEAHRVEVRRDAPYLVPWGVTFRKRGCSHENRKYFRYEKYW